MGPSDSAGDVARDAPETDDDRRGRLTRATEANGASASGGELVTVRRRMNDHDAVTVEVVGTNETRHIVSYASADLRETLSALPTGTRIPLRMEAVSGRGSVWRVTALCGASPNSTDTSGVAPD